MSCGRGSSDGGTGRTSLAVAPSHADDDILRTLQFNQVWVSKLYSVCPFKTVSALEAIEINYLVILEQTGISGKTYSA